MVQCLICQRVFRALGSHLSHAHQLSGREYRTEFDLPQTYPLADDDLRDSQRAVIKLLQSTGALDYLHLPMAVEVARNAGRGVKNFTDTQMQRKVAQAIPRNELPVGSKRADGRDADKARAYQKAYRSRGDL